MEPANTQRRIVKRSSNACTRCRRQKIKCSGLQPCDGCKKRKLSCVFDDRDNKIIVTQGYLSDLHQKIASFESGLGGSHSPSETSHIGQEDVRILDGSGHGPGALQYDERGLDPASNTQESHPAPLEMPPEPVVSDLTNPLAASPSTFVSASNGRTFYFGTSSNWSFSGRILHMTHEHVYQAPLPASALLFDGSAYDLNWDGSRGSAVPDPPTIPSLDYATYLLNAVKFHCGQMFHLFDEGDFEIRLHRFYSDTAERDEDTSLWYIHFLLILAFGKTFILPKSARRRPPGADFFVRATQLLPDVTALCRDPIVATEILCCIALYLQSIDHRNSAHIFIGQAMRMALGYGMHTDMPVADLGEHLVQRCRKIWWTVYILDRQMTSLMGLPQSIRDEDAHCQLPVFPASTQRTAGIGMQIKLARIIAEINSTVYGINGRLNRKFLISTKAALESIAGLADELRQSFPLHLEEPVKGVPRMFASLHLLYHQCIVLATRPLMFCCLKIRFESPSELKVLITSHKIRSLLQMCIESSLQMVNILENLQTQGLLEIFLPFDLDSLFASTMVLLLGLVIDPLLLESRSLWVQRSYAILEEMVVGGNLVAGFRKSEVHRLEEMLSSVPPVDAQQHTASGAAFQNAMQTDNLFLYHHPDSPNNISYSDELTAEQILAVANSIESEDAEWMARTMVDNSIW